MTRIHFTKTIGALFAGGWLAVSLAACDSSADFAFNDCSMGACAGRSGGTGGRSDSGNSSPPEAGSMDAGPSRSLLCGTLGCFPGNPSACPAVPADAAPHLAVVRDDAAADDASSDCDDAQPDDASADATIAPDADNDASVDDASDDGGGGDDASTGDAGAGDATDTGTSDEPKPQQSCYIKPAATGVVTECALAGPGAAGSACNDSSACGALLACVEEDLKGVCRAVYCALPPTCPAGTSYKQEPLRALGVTRPDLVVPVCVPVDNCTLLSPQNPCRAGEACAVVGTAGETTCIVPGDGGLGDSCDEANRCAEGLLCSKFANQCVKICRVEFGAVDCPTGACQGGNRSLPDGFGVCSGETPDGG